MFIAALLSVLLCDPVIIAGKGIERQVLSVTVSSDILPYCLVQYMYICIIIMLLVAF